MPLKTEISGMPSENGKEEPPPLAPSGREAIPVSSKNKPCSAPVAAVEGRSLSIEINPGGQPSTDAAAAQKTPLGGKPPWFPRGFAAFGRRYVNNDLQHAILT
ncbi:hypothetical protein [Inquilinus sp. CAU 1745]|uniref:hypothetical protein n=1 Tax=Inquilinus sp. CAU 1745 TaxID=3140369 RepID=UPI00325B91F4